MRILITILLLVGIENKLCAIEFQNLVFPDSVQVTGKTLLLNGLGVREATFLSIDVYVAALYLQSKSQAAQKIVESNQIKRITMTFVRNVEAPKLRDAWTEGYQKNCGKECKTLRPGLNKLNGLMGDMKEGDILALTFYPTHLVVDRNNKSLGSIQGKQFSPIILSIWLGKEPPNESLKRGLLGMDT